MKISATKATLFFNRFIVVVMVGLIFFLPAFLDWYVTLRPAMRETAQQALVWGFYCCAPAVLPPSSCWRCWGIWWWTRLSPRRSTRMKW